MEKTKNNHYIFFLVTLPDTEGETHVKPPELLEANVKHGPDEPPHNPTSDEPSLEATQEGSAQEHRPKETLESEDSVDKGKSLISL